MQNAQMFLEIVNQRGERRLELHRVYRHLMDQELFLRAYANLYANKGATTRGTDPEDTVDGMSLRRIDEIIETLRAGTYQWKPTRRIYIPKADGRLRPLSIPSWNDKLVQEVIRLVLSAYYEPQFSNHSHGFRPDRGCHTALTEILYNWKGTKWFIEGDIKGCFDTIDHKRLMHIIAQSIKDERLHKLLRGMVAAGYIEDWKYQGTYSGTPQGGVISPLLANIYLNEFDQYVETVLMPKYNQGEVRKVNPEYTRRQRERRKAKATGDMESYRRLEKELQITPYGVPDDPDYRRLKYVRYADDFLIGFVGPRSEAEDIKQEIAAFFDTLGLTLSSEKTLITNATTSNARFLNYEIRMAHANSVHTNGRRSINGTPILQVPTDVATTWRLKYQRAGKPYHRTELLNSSDYDIVSTYGVELQGIINYYEMAHDVSYKLYPVKYAYTQSLVKTLACKHKKPVTWVWKNHWKKQSTGVSAIVVTVTREGKPPLVATCGAKPIRHKKTTVIEEKQTQLLPGRNELVTRLLAEQCELCGATGEIEMHHIRKLKDLKRRWQGRAEPPEWVKRMIERRRKTLAVCKKCHVAIGSGRYDGTKVG